MSGETTVKILGPNVAGAWNVVMSDGEAIKLAVSLSNAQMIILKAAITGHLNRHGDDK